MAEILIGYVNEFNFNDPQLESVLPNHPKKGGIYRIVKINNTYRLYIGKFGNNTKYDGIVLGSELKSKSDETGGWDFDIEIITKDNLLAFPLSETDLIDIQKWLEPDGNADLEKLLKLPMHAKIGDEIVEIGQLDSGEEITISLHETENSKEATAGDVNPELEDISNRVDKTVNEFLDGISKFEKSMMEISSNINFILYKDPEMMLILNDLLGYLASTYSDKYESSDRPNLGKMFLLGSKSSDTALFNSMKYLQRYCTQGFEKSGNVKDIYKAMHYCLFELMRRKLNDSKNNG